MKKNSPTIIILVIVAILTLGILGAVYFMYSVIRQENIDAAQALLEVQQVEKHGEQSEELQSFLVKNSNSIALLESYFIPEQGVVSFVNTVEGYARGLGVTPEVNQLEIVPSANGNDFKESLYMTITVNGDWGGVFQFLKLFESLPYQVNIKNVRLTRSATVQSTQKSTTSSTSSWSLSIDSTILKLAQ